MEHKKNIKKHNVIDVEQLLWEHIKEGLLEDYKNKIIQGLVERFGPTLKHEWISKNTGKNL